MMRCGLILLSCVSVGLVTGCDADSDATCTHDVTDASADTVGPYTNAGTNAWTSYTGEDTSQSDTALPPLAAPRQTNPFVGSAYYVNPDYATTVEAAKDDAPAELHRAMDVVKSTPTAIWLDRLAAVEGNDDDMGVRAHLDAAVAQAETTELPVLVMFVIYDLPGRDCAALASNGELALGPEALATYKTRFIDRIISDITADPAYDALRIVTLIEPDSLPNLITNLDLPSCAAAAPAYREGIAYAISKFGVLDNVYVYLDIAQSSWLGWEHTERAARIYADVLNEAGGGQLIRGFATNTSNYVPLFEPFDPYTNIDQNMDLIEGFYEWNRMIDELTYIEVLQSHFPLHHFIVDTGRNGWPIQAQRPIDQRTHRGNWCNVSGAGIGERPMSSPRPGIDAFFWVKPPGQSDGTSDPDATEPNHEGKRFDPMCGASEVVRPYSGGTAIPTDALTGAPHAGKWFQSQFIMLLENATPPL